MDDKILIGPFKQIITMDNLPLKGPLRDEHLQIMDSAGILIQSGKIVDMDSFSHLKKKAFIEKWGIQMLEGNHVALPGMIDPHTHICYAGSRSNDYALSLAGMSYLEIAGRGGGIWSTVTDTRIATDETLFLQTRTRASSLLKDGVTTVEVKSGYALNLEGELRMLKIINQVNDTGEIDLISTCLAAHMLPKDFQGSASQYLDYLVQNLLPAVLKRKLTSRVDVYIDKNAFSKEEGQFFLQEAMKLGFDLTVHADQFTTGGSEVAVMVGAISADHLEASSDEEIALLAKSDVIPVCLPGASMGLGVNFAPARRILDAGCSLAIASDWNPGSAPMGDILMQASIMGAYEHLTMAETLAAVTYRAAAALNIRDRGILKNGKMADIIAFPVSDYRDILYYQGKMKPLNIWKKGKPVSKT
jgi:imidazolonepropionase